MAARCVALLVTLAALLPAAAAAQTPPDSTATRTHRAWGRFAAGFATSILAHEAGHIAASLLQGARPSFGMDRGRPTVYSGIDPTAHPHQQFMFSSAGLDVQAILDELILDSPHHAGGAFQRGVLSAGLATTAFYLTLGRTARVSDVAYMRRTSGLSAAQITLIYGGVSLMHAVRIARDGRFANFFLRPGPPGSVVVGIHLN